MPSLNTIDPLFDFDLYFFGVISREKSEEILMKCEVGDYILRNSTSMREGLSLSVRDSSDGPHQIHHYLINASPEKEDDEKNVVMLGNRYFTISHIILRGRNVKVEHTKLRLPAPRKIKNIVVAKFKFDGQTLTDLPFARDEVLEILKKPDANWWYARNILGMVGMIPSPFVKTQKIGDDASRSNTLRKPPKKKKPEKERPFKQLVIPAMVKVVANRRPSIYDAKSMTLKIGQMIHLTKVYKTGICFGTNQDTGFPGTFPFTFVKWTNEPVINIIPPRDPNSAITDILPH